MLFNSYVWDLYKNSENGRKTIAEFVSPSRDKLRSEFNMDDGIFELVDEKEIEFWGKKTVPIFLPPYVRNFAAQHSIASSSDAETLYTQLIRKGIPVTAPDATGKLSVFLTFGGGEETYEEIVINVPYMSLGLYLAHPNYFLPYLFSSRFFHFQKICEEFDIPIPPVPGKKKWNERVMYYLRLNESLQEFRRLQGLSPAEMCAFLYDFAPNALKEKETELPAPSKVWLVTGGAGGNGDFEFVDQSDETTNTHWQGNVDTRRGDIILMYCVSPRSYIHSIWRATTDGFIDPFFFYHSTVWVGHPIKTTEVSFKDMAAHPLLSEKGAIKAHLQGPSGKAFTVEEYEAVLEMMAKKGQDLSPLPSVVATTFIPEEELINERDVELKLVEPLLKKLGYEPKDWVRQMSVSMGRGERNYPDYAFGAQTKKGDEKAEMVLEAKYNIKIRRELTDAYRQAKSYALRLQSKMIVLAAVEGVWIFDGSNGFDFDRFIHKNWKELEHPDTLHQIRKAIGK